MEYLHIMDLSGGLSTGMLTHAGAKDHKIGDGTTHVGLLNACYCAIPASDTIVFSFDYQTRSVQNDDQMLYFFLNRKTYSCLKM